MDKITKEEFEKYWTGLGGHTVDDLRRMGLVAKPCDCDYEGCQGWQMAGDDNWKGIEDETTVED